MRKVVTLFVAIALFSILFSVFYSFAEEKITLTTYYPAPYGVYKDMRTNTLAVGKNLRNTPTELNDGWLLVNETIVIGGAPPASSSHKLWLAAAGDGAGLILFDTEREWEFRQRGTAGGAALELRSQVANKYFNITSATNHRTAAFYASDAINSRVLLVPGGGRVGIGTDDPGEMLSIKGNDEILNFHVSDTQAIASNAYYSGGWKYAASSRYAEKIHFGDGTLTLSVAPMGTANQPITWKDRIRIASNGYVGINTAAPSAELDVVGNIRMRDGFEGANKVLVSNANGVAKWKPITVLRGDSSGYMGVEQCPDRGSGYRLVVTWCWKWHRCTGDGAWLLCSDNYEGIGWAQGYIDAGCSVCGFGSDPSSRNKPPPVGLCVPAE